MTRTYDEVIAEQHGKRITLTVEELQQFHRDAFFVGHETSRHTPNLRGSCNQHFAGSWVFQKIKGADDERPSIAAEQQRVIQMLLNVCGAAFVLGDDSCVQEVDGESSLVMPPESFEKLWAALDEIENTLPSGDPDRPQVILGGAAIPRAVLKSLLPTEEKQNEQ